MYQKVIQILDKLNLKTVSADYYAQLESWKEWYDGDVQKFHRYIVDTGTQKLEVRRYSAGMAKQVCEDWADLLMNEKVEIAVEGKAESDFIQKVLTDNNWAVKANEMQEVKGYAGTVAYVPHIVGAVLDSTGTPTGNAEGIVIDYIPAAQIFPLSWRNGIIRECAFAQDMTSGDKTYIYLQLHVIGEKKEYEIQNKLYDLGKNVDGTPQEVPLDTLSDLAGIPAVVYTHNTEPQFVIDRYALKSNVDGSGPMGIAVFANAIDQLKATDIAYDSYVNEFVLGKKRVMVKPQAVKDLDGNPVFDTNELVFYVLPEDGSPDTIIKELDMSLRVEQHSQGLQDMLNMLSHKCGLGNSFYRFEGGKITTATEVISTNSKLFRTLKKHEIVLNSAVINLCRILLRLANQFGGQTYNVDTDIVVNFDDSIIEDTAAEFQRDVQLVGLGAMGIWELRAKYMGESAEEAKKNIPDLEAQTQTQEPPEE